MNSRVPSEASTEAPSQGRSSERRKLLLACFALVVSGALQALISPPLNWWVLHPISWIPALYVLSQARGNQALLAGWLVGIAANATIFYWVIHTVRSFSNLPLPAAVLCLLAFALFWGFYAGIFGLVKVGSALSAKPPVPKAAAPVRSCLHFPGLAPHSSWTGTGLVLGLHRTRDGARMSLFFLFYWPRINISSSGLIIF